MNVEIGAEAAQFLFWENINRIFLAVRSVPLIVTSLACRPIAVLQKNGGSVCGTEAQEWAGQTGIPTA
jgi:hypothetical protein